MNKLQVITIFVFLFCAGFGLSAQTNTPINTSKNQPVLIDDLHTDSYKQAAGIMRVKNKSVLGLVSGLTEKQKKSVARIEKCYSKKWQQMQSKFELLKRELNVSLEAKNEKQIGILNNKISETAIALKKLNAKAYSKITKKLTTSQIAELEKK